MGVEQEVTKKNNNDGENGTQKVTAKISIKPGEERKEVKEEGGANHTLPPLKDKSFHT